MRTRARCAAGLAPEPDEHPPTRRALLLRAGALGDLLLLRPAIAALKHASFQVTLLAPGNPGAALIGDGGADAATLLDWDRPETANLFSSEGPAPRSREWLRSYQLWIAYSRSVPLARQLFQGSRRLYVLDPKPPPGWHAAEWFRRPMAAMGLPLPDPAPCVANLAEENQAAGLLRQLPAGFLAIHPGSGSPRKNWPIAGFARLITEAHAGRNWLLVTGPAERKLVTPLQALPGCVTALELPFRVLGAVLSRCGAFVGNDSGISHLAAAWGAATIAIFGPTDPDAWRPLGSRVSVIRAPGGQLGELRVGTVLAAVRAARGSC